MRLAALLLACSSGFAAVDVSDQALVPLLQAVDPTLTTFSSIARKHVTADYDLVLVLGNQDGPWNEASRLGIFLQERQPLDRFYIVGTEPHIRSDCAFEIQRLTAEDIVFGCGVGTYGYKFDHHHLLYDIQTRTIVRQESFLSFGTERVLGQQTGNPLFFMDNGQTIVPVAIDQRGTFRIADPRDSSILTKLGVRPGMSAAQFFSAVPDFLLSREEPFDKAFGFEFRQNDSEPGKGCGGVVEQTARGEKCYPMPQSSIQKYRALRPDAPVEESNWEEFRSEGIGPHQVEGRRLWFGVGFGSGETMGLGGLGYFDMETRKFTLYSPPEVAPWSTNALLLQPDAVWLGLARFLRRRWVRNGRDRPLGPPDSQGAPPAV